MRKALVLAGTALLVLAGPLEAATTHSVLVRDNAFEPGSIRARIGDTVAWSGSTQSGHNVREDHGIFTSGRPTNEIDYQLVFSAGTFEYFCTTHGGPNSGMRGVVKVPARIGAAPAGRPFTVTWATSSTDTGSKFDVQYRIGSRRWRPWKNDTSSVKATFGAREEPTAVSPGSRYSFRARSSRGARTSLWSPLTSFRP
jgi:plastocyanin